MYMCTYIVHVLKLMHTCTCICVNDLLLVTLPSLCPHCQVRVFIHSTNGQVMEQDLSAVGHEPLPSLEASIGGVASEEMGTHDDTTNKSMAMDLTLGVESVPSEPNLAAFQQVHVRGVSCLCRVFVVRNVHVLTAHDF